MEKLQQLSIIKAASNSSLVTLAIPKSNYCV